MATSNFLLLTAALCLSAVSAYYSIIGLAAIFSASWWAVVILATVLEVCKLILAGWLYRNWHGLHILLRTYLSFSVVVLMLITSLGIFGFLSKAHVEQAVANSDVALSISHVDSQIAAKQADMTRSQTALAQLDRSIDVQLNTNRAQSALAARRQQQSERADLLSQINTAQTEITRLTGTRVELERSQQTQQGKLGPIIYVIELFGSGSDPQRAVKWIIAVLVLVCDPLAVLMVIASSVRSGSSTVSSASATPVTPIGELKWDPSQNQMVFWDGNTWKSTMVERTPLPQHEEDRSPVRPIDQLQLLSLIERTAAQLSQPNASTPRHVENVDRPHINLADLQEMIQQAVLNITPLRHSDDVDRPHINLADLQEMIQQAVLNITPLHHVENVDKSYINLADLQEMIQQAVLNITPVRHSDDVDKSYINLADLQEIIKHSVETSTQTYLDSNLIKQLINGTMEDCLSRTFGVIYNAEHTKIQGMVDQVIEPGPQQINSVTVVPAPSPEIVNNHREPDGKPLS